VTTGVGVALGVGVVTRRGGAGVAEGLAAAVLFGVAVGLGVASVCSGSGVVVGVDAGTVGMVATLTFVMSRPARSMANQAVADTPATAASQIAAMPLAERRVITMWPLCHLPNEQPAKRTTQPRRSVLLWQLSC
jgi:hypothetical protein